ncbi:MAG: hypothetical protein HYT67_02335 [Candidatus Yanofskybacteria bacterium]|nr:hypothetical protein [Candidatus Yanofskybacteria bacterium]MBI2594791.1 hypothetical protein [Candidatus Colwellbacteria bacterium]
MARIVDLRKPKKKVEEPPKKVEEALVVRQKPEKLPEPEIIAAPAKMDEAKSPPRFQWNAPSFYYNPQKKYLALIVIALMAGAVALLFYDRDMLLAIFLMLSSLVLVLYINKRPGVSKIRVDQTGVSINDRTYYYRELKSFWIDYTPYGPKELSLEARKWYLPHIKVSLEQEDPLELRSLMVNFVPERVHEQSLVDFIARKLGL